MTGVRGPLRYTGRTMRTALLACLVLGSLVVVGCGSDDAPTPTDTGAIDSGVADTVVADTSVSDTSVTDTSTTDTSVADTGTPETATDAADADARDGADASDLEVKCTSTGGTVGTALCCASASDFPNRCLTGACGCAPSSSKDVKVCNCPSGKCFDGTGCVAGG